MLSIISAILIANDLNLAFCWKKACLENFVAIFNIPLSLLGLSFVATGAAFAYYRIELNYEQNERQLQQFTQSNYVSFRSEFLALISEIDYDFEVIDLPSSWLFNTLYPNAKSGDFKLNPEFEEFVLDKDDLQGFVGAMNALSETLTSHDGKRYWAGSHMPIANLFIWLRNIVTLDADVNFGFVSGASFTGEYSKNIIGIAKDILFIVSCVNTFEGWRLFENKDRRIWRKNIDRLTSVQEEAEALKEYLKNSTWLTVLMGNKLDVFEKVDILNDLPSNLRNNENAKHYIYECYTMGSFSSILSDEEKKALASSLHLRQQ